MPQVKSEGIILRSVNWKENSKIVTIFTENYGRVSVIDRGGRSIKSKRGRLLTFSRLELNYFRSEKSGMGYISEVEPLESYGFEKDGTLGRLTFASAALELLNDLLPEDEPMEALYFFTLQYLKSVNIANKHAIMPIFLAYLLRTLSLLGYRPNFYGCIGCGKPDDDSFHINGDREGKKKLFLLSPKRGGLVCNACQMMGEYYIRFSSERLKTIQALQVSSLAEAAMIPIKYTRAEEILELLGDFLRYQTDIKELRFLKFLEKLKRTNL